MGASVVHFESIGGKGGELERFYRELAMFADSAGNVTGLIAGEAGR